MFDILYGRNLGKVLNIGIGILTALWGFTISYAFPLQARFQNSIRHTLTNALALAFRNLPATAAMAALNSIPALCVAAGEFYTRIAMPFFCVAGFSCIVRINSLMLTRIFQKIQE